MSDKDENRVVSVYLNAKELKHLAVLLVKSDTYQDDNAGHPSFELSDNIFGKTCKGLEYLKNRKKNGKDV